MPKYIFSQGQITVDDGVYDPVMEEKRRADNAGVILIVNRPPIKRARKEQDHVQA